jgi:glucose-1-phosphate thymidylyltransferase
VTAAPAGPITDAAILARGVGARMRHADATVSLGDAQAAVADAGLKGMIPIDRPFLDYVLSELADAGITDVVFVIGPDHERIRTYYTDTAPPRRVRVQFAVQAEPIGTADAVRAAADVIGERPFLVLNADNHYPASVVRVLSARADAGVVAFDRDALLADGAIAPERLRQYAVLDIDADGLVRDVLEKPGASLDLSSEAARWVSMNLWAITPALVSACRRVPRSARGEFELPQAVAMAIREGAVRVRAERVAASVLDLSVRADVPRVSARLQGVPVEP